MGQGMGVRRYQMQTKTATANRLTKHGGTSAINPERTNSKTSYGKAFTPRDSVTEVAKSFPLKSILRKPSREKL